MLEDLIARVRRLLLTPQAGWEAIAAEPVEGMRLYTHYVAPLAAIPAAAGFLGGLVFGRPVDGITIRPDLATALGQGILNFGFALAGVFIVARIIDWLAPRFGAERNLGQATKIAAYWPTAHWLAGALHLIPAIGLLALLGSLYSLYLLFLGLPKLMKPPPEKATTYTLATLGAAVVVFVALALLVAAFAPRSAGGFGALSYRPSASPAGADRADIAERVEEAGRTGDFGALLGALRGEGAAPAGPPVAAADLEALLPERVAGLARGEVSAESIPAPIQGTAVSARYGEGERRLTLQISESAMHSAMLASLGLGGANYDKKSGANYRKLRREKGEIIAQEWDAKAKRATYMRSVAGRFLVTAEGDGVTMADAEKAVDAVSRKRLETLAKGG